MKFFLPFLALVSSVIGSTDVDHRRAQTALENQWRVDDPTVSYNSVTDVFTMEFLHGVGDYYVTIEVYDVCPNGDADYTGATFEGAPLYYWYNNYMGIDFLDDEIPDGWTYISGPPDLYNAAWDFKINSLVATSDAYTESAGVGTVSFCIRGGLVDFEQDPEELTLVNFKQFMLTINFDLTSGFEVSSFATQVIEEVTGTASDSFETTAELCAESGPGPFNQGQEICLTVCPEDDSLVDVASIDSLTLVIDGAPNDASQVVIAGGVPVGNVVAAPECGVDSCCQVRFILNALFFPVGLPDTPPVATVTGNGDCTLTFTSRRLLGESPGRALQKTTTSEFDATFDIEREEPLASDAAASFFTKTNVAAAAGVAGAALLL